MPGNAAVRLPHAFPCIHKLSASERGVYAASLSLLPQLSLNSNLVGSFTLKRPEGRAPTNRQLLDAPQNGNNRDVRAIPGGRILEPPPKARGNGARLCAEHHSSTTTTSSSCSPKEIIDYGAMRGVPKDYCEHYHSVCTEKHRWLVKSPGGERVIVWQSELVRWWTRDR